MHVRSYHNTPPPLGTETTFVDLCNVDLCKGGVAVVVDWSWSVLVCSSNIRYVNPVVTWFLWDYEQSEEQCDQYGDI